MKILLLISIFLFCGCQSEVTYQTATPYQREMGYYKFGTEPTNYIDYEELNWLLIQDGFTNN